MTFEFEKTMLWQRTLAERPNDADASARTRFRNAFLSSREAVAPLVAQIGKELPALTVHDITHLDALWGVADVVLGREYPINPAEGFVLGMAFLLHDAATSTAAFENGIEDVKATVEWKDLVAQRKWDIASMNPGTPQYQAALFEVLRTLHPKQAEKLLHIEWKLIDGSKKYLLEESQIRTYYGNLIGKIAHSHWWDAATVEQEWANSRSLTLHSSFQVAEADEWKVDAFKVALILRCVDAAHIDSRRAPDMMAAIVQPQGISRMHWFFQNRLGLPSVDPRSELYWTAGKPFDEEHAEAWWLCFDTAKMIDNEIRRSNRLLDFNGRTSFRTRGVSGTASAAEFSKNVPVQGWHPIDVNFKVTQVTDVVEKFGGTKLYGDNPWMALRELLQNAADAIRARRAKRKINAGEITVALYQDNESWWLEITDNGIGMSQYVLTEVLLDFGRSLWNDSAIRTEHPGLIASGFKSTGQFGIGFLSVFMLGDEVKVTSWRDGDADNRQSTLWIQNGVKSRPLLLSTPESERLNEYGSKVQIRLKTNANEGLLAVNSVSGTQVLTIEQLVGAIAPTLDIDIYVALANQKSKLIAAGDWITLSSTDLIKRIAPLTQLKSYNFTTIEVKEKNAGTVGRIDVCYPWFSAEFFRSPGILTQNGLLAGTVSGIAGVLMAENNTNLTRTSALPVCSRYAIEACVKQIAVQKQIDDVWFRRNHINRLISLGLSFENIVFSEHDPKVLNPISIRQWIDEEIIAAGYDTLTLPLYSYEPPKDVSAKDFESYFESHANVLELSDVHSDIDRRERFGLGEWIDKLVPIDVTSPRNLPRFFLKTLQEAYPNLEYEQRDAVVGEVKGIDVLVECIVVKGFV